MRKLLAFITASLIASACSIDMEYYDCLRHYLTSKKFEINGLFYAYDFNKDGHLAKNDWIYLDLKSKMAYRLLGRTPSQKDVFGWQKLHSLPADFDGEKISGLFIRIDFDKEPDKRFSWIYVALSGHLPIFKLSGQTPSGSFAYFDKDCDGKADRLEGIVVDSIEVPSQAGVELPGQESFDRYLISFAFDGVPIDCAQSGVNSSSVSSSAHSSATSLKSGQLFPDVNETKVIKELPGTQVQVTTDINRVTLIKSDDAVQIASNEALPLRRGYYLVRNGVKRTDRGKGLFVGEKFAGVIKDVRQDANGVVVRVENAKELYEAYKHLELEQRTNGVASLTRSLLNVSGKYDGVNEKGLRVSIVSHSSPLRNSTGINDLALRVEFPKGYKIPVQLRGVDCSFWQASCSFSTDFQGKRRTDLGYNYNYPEDGPFITFDSNGSYLEIGIGTYLYLYYDYNAYTKDVFRFNFVQSAKLKSDLKFKLVGNLKYLSDSNLSFEKDVNILSSPLKVYIPTPYSEAISTYIEIMPTITLGVAGEINGTFRYHTTIKRSGEMRFAFDSESGSPQFFTTIKDNAPKSGKNDLSVTLEAQAQAYLFPNLTIIPVIAPLHVEPVTLVSAQAGLKLNNEMSGKIDKNFIAESEEGLSTYAQVKSELYGLVRAKLMAKAGDVVLYDGDYADLYQSPAITILDWKVALLHKPQIIEKEKGNNTAIFFKIDDEALMPYIKFYYSIGESLETTPDLIRENFLNFPYWQIGMEPLELDGSKALKVRAYLSNKDISTSIWSWGASLSEQKEYLVIKVLPPQFQPNSTVFKGSFTVSLFQPQSYDIYCSLDGGTTFKKYTMPITLTQNSTIIAYAATMVNGKNVESQRVTASYKKCKENEEVKNGKCISQSSSSSSTSNGPQSWDDWPDTQGCPWKGSDINLGPDKILDLSGGGKLHCWYNRHGTLWKEIPYRNGKVDGVYKEYFPSGQIRYIIPYRNGLRYGVVKIYTESGCLKEEHYYQNGQEISSNLHNCEK